MEDRKQIHDFAIKWCDKFRDRNINYIELIDHFMADDCEALGFKMDCGYAFSEKYGQAASEYAALDRIIDEITDISLLGSAIYSRWRYFNHWAYDGAEIKEPQNRAWFILALSRLALLSGDNPFIFKGTLKKMRVVSNNICYVPMPGSHEEVEQHLTINSEGRVWFSGYRFVRFGERYEKARSRNFRIDQSDADRLLGAIAEHFGNEYTETFVTDVGNWVMELTNTEGVTYQFKGSLCADFDHSGTDLSALVRDTVGMDDLYVFDGNCKPEVINKITIDYHSVTKIKPDQKPEDAECGVLTRDYTERLMIDRATETLEHIQNIGSGWRVSRRYEMKGGIESLLNHFNAEELFYCGRENPDDIVETPDDIRTYTITIEYKNNPSRTITGSCDKNGLPDDFPEFAEAVSAFTGFFGSGEILDPSVYGRVKRRKSELIFCSVLFDMSGKSYYYLTDDDTIEEGDFVLVPAGKDNHEAVVEVINVEYFTESEAPFPLEKTKRIIRKCTAEELVSPGE